MAVQTSDLIELNTLVSYIIKKTDDFLEHDGDLNQTITDTVPVCSESTAAWVPTANWTYTVSQCQTDIEKLCLQFVNSNSNDPAAPEWNTNYKIFAKSTLQFIEQCFYVLERIFAYKFSYYETAESELTYRTYYGLKSQYHSTFNAYKTAFENAYTSDVSAIIGTDNVKYGLETKTVGKIIKASNISDIITDLINFNKDQEKYWDYGNRNYKKTKYYYKVTFDHTENSYASAMYWWYTITQTHTPLTLDKVYQTIESWSADDKYCTMVPQGDGFGEPWYYCYKCDGPYKSESFLFATASQDYTEGYIHKTE